MAIKGVLEKKDKKENSIFYKNVVLALVGLGLFLVPRTFNNIVGIVIGFVFLLAGLMSIFNYLQNKIGDTNNFINGILYSVFGVFIMLYPSSVVRLIALCIGIYLFIKALIKAKEAFMFKEMENNWVGTFVVSVLFFLVGGLLIFNPVSTLVLTKILGMVLIIISLMDIFSK